MDFFLNEHLEKKKEYGLQRQLQINNGIDFYSNDYLGFVSDKKLSLKILDRLQSLNSSFSGATGSRLLSGHHSLFEDIEKKLSIFSNTQSAIFFPSGYQANISLISSVCRKGDLIFSDELNHASIIDGIRLSSADKEIFQHCCLESLEKKLIKHKGLMGNKFIVCESIYSMEGDHAPLKEISKLAKKYNAHLIVDESHSTGLFGENGSGLVNHLGLRDEVLCTMHTAGKALGVSGAWVAGSKTLKEFLVNFSRGLIYSTAPSPIQFIMVEQALLFLKSSFQRSGQILSRAKYLRNRLKINLSDTSVVILGENTPIIPIILKENDFVLNVQKDLKNYNINIAAIRSPTVEVGSARLRLTINYLNCGDHLNNLLEVLPGIIRRYI